MWSNNLTIFVLICHPGPIVDASNLWFKLFGLYLLNSLFNTEYSIPHQIINVKGAWRVEARSYDKCNIAFFRQRPKYKCLTHQHFPDL